jgi:hypothetical protein
MTLHPLRSFRSEARQKTDPAEIQTNEDLGYVSSLLWRVRSTAVPQLNASAKIM